MRWPHAEVVLFQYLSRVARHEALSNLNASTCQFHFPVFQESGLLNAQHLWLPSGRSLTLYVDVFRQFQLQRACENTFLRFREHTERHTMGLNQAPGREVLLEDEERIWVRKGNAVLFGFLLPIQAALCRDTRKSCSLWSTCWQDR